MSNQLLSGGNYGATSPSGAPISLSPAMLEAMLIMPQIQAMIRQNMTAGGGPPNTNQLSGIMNWAQSQAGSPRAIAPTIPGLSLPPQVQAIMAQRAPIATKANELAQRVVGAPQVSPVTGQFAPTGAPASPTSQAPTSGATGVATPDFVNQIVQQAVQSVLSGSGGQETGSGSGGVTSGPIIGGGSDIGGVSGAQTGDIGPGPDTGSGAVEGAAAGAAAGGGGVGGGGSGTESAY